MGTTHQEGVIDAVSRTTNSIGYAGLYGVLNRTEQSCGVKFSRIINRAGVAVKPSVASAQAAVRSFSLNIIHNSSCPGFGICGEVIDGGDEDVWPITAITVSQSKLSS